MRSICQQIFPKLAMAVPHGIALVRVVKAKEKKDARILTLFGGMSSKIIVVSEFGQCCHVSQCWIA